MNAISPIGPSETFLARPVPDDPKLIAEYFAQVNSFQADRLRWAQRGMGLSMVVAACALVGAGAAAFTAASLAIRPVPEPIVLRVDNATGIVDRIFDVQGSMAASEAEKRHWLWTYVLAAEGYSFAEAQRNFDVVTLMSTPDVQTRFSERVRGSNPQAPQVVLGRTGQSSLTWISTTFIGPKLAQVRYVQIERKGDTRLPEKRMVATIAFDFASGPVTGSAINVNPRGFLVTEYHVDQEGAR